MRERAVVREKKEAGRVLVEAACREQVSAQVRDLVRTARKRFGIADQVQHGALMRVPGRADEAGGFVQHEVLPGGVLYCFSLAGDVVAVPDGGARIADDPAVHGDCAGADQLLQFFPCADFHVGEIFIQPQLISTQCEMSCETGVRNSRRIFSASPVCARIHMSFVIAASIVMS